MYLRSLLWALPLLLLGSTPASAELITFAFSGTIDYAEGQWLSPGDPVAGFYQFESTTPGLIPADDIGVNYAAIQSFSVHAGSHTISGSSGSIHVHFDAPELGGENGYGVRMSHGTTGSSLWDVYLSLFDITAPRPLVTDESIQTSPPSLANATSATGVLLSARGEYGFSINRLAPTSVPEPGSAGLLSVGLVALVALRSVVLRTKVRPKADLGT
jgi:hypothetical protein